MAFNYQHGVPACREQGSLRFHLWQHSHSVPVRWRRGVAAAEVAQAGVARAALAVEQVEQAAHPEPQATQAAGPVVRAATALLNPPAAKAVRVEILLLNLPAARARIALTRQGRALGRGALVRTVKKTVSAIQLRPVERLSGDRHYLSILDQSHSLLCLPIQGWHETPSVAAPWAGFRMHRNGLIVNCSNYRFLLFELETFRDVGNVAWICKLDATRFARRDGEPRPHLEMFSTIPDDNPSLCQNASGTVGRRGLSDRSATFATMLRPAQCGRSSPRRGSKPWVLTSRLCRPTPT
jgi:hypothetical protein